MSRKAAACVPLDKTCTFYIILARSTQRLSFPERFPVGPSVLNGVAVCRVQVSVAGTPSGMKVRIVLAMQAARALSVGSTESRPRRVWTCHRRASQQSSWRMDWRRTQAQLWYSTPNAAAQVRTTCAVSMLDFSMAAVAQGSGRQWVHVFPPWRV
jgi:hypothetical protein